MKFAKTLILTAAFGVASTAAISAHEDAENPVVIERMKGMEAIGASMGVLSGMAKGEMEFDAAKADAAVAAIVENGILVPALFEANETDPASEALPAVWENWDDFVAKNTMMVDAAKSVGPIADQGSIGKALGAIGGTCKGCHKDYRKK